SFLSSVDFRTKTKSRFYWRNLPIMSCLIFFGMQTMFAQTYCIPTSPNGCDSGDNINTLIIDNGSGINHIDSGCSPAGYGDFTGTSGLFGTFMQGEVYNFSVTHTYQTQQYVRIYIDFNEDGDFEDEDELLFSSASGTTAGLTTGTFTIPLTAPLTSSTRLRVINTYNALSTNSCDLIDINF